MVSRRFVIGGLFGTAVAGAGAWHFRPRQTYAPEISQRPQIRPARGLQYVVLNAENGKTIIGQQQDAIRQPASLTKMMTLACVFDALSNPDTDFNLASRVTIPKYINNIGSGIAVFENLKPGQEHSVEDLLIGCGSRSDAYSTIALALHLGSPNVYAWGNDEDENAAHFLNLMNEKAIAIGMGSSHFSVMTGLPHSENLSTPSDMARLIEYLVSNYPQSSEIALGQPHFDLNPISSSTTHTSRFLRANPEEIDFAKTGWTNAAGFCLGVYSDYQDTKLIGVVFGARDRNHRNQVMRQILDSAREQIAPEVTISTRNVTTTQTLEQSPRPVPRPPRQP